MVQDAAVLAYLASTALLTGLAWTVHLLVYPAFRTVGPQGPDVWAAHHARHSRVVGALVAGPWLVQGVATAVLLLHPSVPVLLAAALSAATVALTVLGAVPCHTRLGAGYDDAQVDRLLRWDLLRALAWSGCAVVGVALVLGRMGA